MLEVGWVCDEIPWEDKVLFLREFPGPFPNMKHKLLVLQTVLGGTCLLSYCCLVRIEALDSFSYPGKYPMKDLNGVSGPLKE